MMKMPARNPATFESLTFPATGGSYVRDPASGELTPNIEDPRNVTAAVSDEVAETPGDALAQPAEEPAQ